MKLILILPFILFTSISVQAQDGTLNEYEKKFLFDNWEVTKTELLKTINQVSDDDWTKRPKDGGWSVAECFEHIVLAVPAQIGQVKQAITQEQNASKDLSAKDGFLLSLMTNRGNTFQTPLPPREGDISKEDLLTTFNSLDQQFKALANNDEIPFRYYFGQSPFGEADTFQLMLLTSGHVLRHTLQMKEVIAELEAE